MGRFELENTLTVCWLGCARVDCNGDMVDVQLQQLLFEWYPLRAAEPSIDVS